MNAGLSRFILASLLLHLGALAMLGNAAPRLPLFPSTLRVSLDDAPASLPTRSRPVGQGATVADRHRHPPALTPEPSAPRSASPSEPLPPARALDPVPASASDNTGAGAPPDTEPAEAMAREPGAANGPADSPQPVATDQLASQLESRLRDAMAPYFVYPLMARRNGWQGQVEVGLRVEADGRLSHLHITRSSGYGLLDSAALTTLNGIDVLPDAAGWLEGRHFDMVLPIEYRLIGGQS